MKHEKHQPIQDLLKLCLISGLNEDEIIRLAKEAFIETLLEVKQEMTKEKGSIQ